jgi:hypothetical protein
MFDTRHVKQIDRQFAFPLVGSPVFSHLGQSGKTLVRGRFTRRTSG